MYVYSTNEPSDELNGYRPSTLAEAFYPRRLELIILPTEQCNFRCTYCYEDFSIGKMKPNVVQAIKELIKVRVQDLESLNLSWFGGEPLAAKDICLDISEYAYELCKQNNVLLTGGLTTNGSLLTPNLMKELVGLNQNHFQITLDGDRELHNKTRIKADGSGTFDKIWNNLISLSRLDLDYHITLRLHVTPDNIESQRNLIEKINIAFDRDDRFSVFFHSVNNLGGANADSIKSLARDKYTEAVSELKKLIKGTSESASELDLVKNKEICYAAKPNSLLVRANGRLGKCTVALNDDRNDIGFIKNDGTIEIYNDKLAVWMLGFKDLDDQFLSCPWGSLNRLTKKYAVENIKVVAA